MELLQNRRYKPEEISSLFIDELKIIVTSIVELCQEGKISTYDAAIIIINEIDCSASYQKEALQAIGATYNELEYYIRFLMETVFSIYEAVESADYQENRKANIKQQIIQGGLSSLLVNTGNINEQEYKTNININEHFKNELFRRFPEFEKDIPLLKKHNFLEINDTGLHWKKSKQSLAEYFKSIKPATLDHVPWAAIGKIFGETDLKNSASSNGNEFKKPSKDFEDLQKIKNTPAGKQNTP